MRTTRFDDFDYDDCPDLDELIREKHDNSTYHRELMRHPSCQDPDHPGCISCEPENFIE